MVFLQWLILRQQSFPCRQGCGQALFRIALNGQMIFIIA